MAVPPGIPAGAAPAGDLDEGAVADAPLGRVGRVQFAERLRFIAGELGDQAAAGLGMPLVADAAGGQQQGELGVGQFVARSGLARPQPAAAVRGREAAIGEQALRPGMIEGRAGPLHTAFGAQPGVRQSGHVAVGAAGAGAVFGEDRSFIREVEPSGEAHGGGDVAEDAPVGQRLARGGLGGLDEMDAAFRGGHRPGLFWPGRGREDDVGEGQGVIGVGVLNHHQLGPAQRRVATQGRRHARHRIGGDDPHRLAAARVQRLDQFDGGEAGQGRDGAAGDAPEVLDHVAVRFARQ